MTQAQQHPSFVLARRARTADPGARKPVGPPPIALRLVAVLAVPLVFYALYATGLKALDNYRLSQQAEVLRQQVLELRQENVDLLAQLERSRTDAAVEEIAREQLGLVNPGDNPVVVVGAGPATRLAPVAQSRPTAPSTAPPLQQWWDLFFGN